MSKTVWKFVLHFFEFLPLPPQIRANLLRLSGAQVGKDVKICNGVSIRSDDLSEIKIGDGVFIGRNVEINCCKLIMASDVQIGSQTIIYGHECQIGHGSFIGTNVFIDATKQVSIGRRVVIANQSHIYTSDTSFAWIAGGYPRKESPVTIKEGAWIGPQAIITPGMNIAEKTTVAGSSLIMKSTRPYSVNMGVPAHQVGNQKEKIDQHKQHFNTFRELRKSLPELLDERIVPAENTDYTLYSQDKSIGILFWQGKTSGFEKKLDEARRGLDDLIIFTEGNIAELAETCKTASNILLIDIRTQEYIGAELAIMELIKAKLRWWGIILCPY